MKKLECNESQRVNFAGSGENLPDIAKSRDASMDNKDFRSLLISLLKIFEFEKFSIVLEENCRKLSICFKETGSRLKSRCSCAVSCQFLQKQ